MHVLQQRVRSSGQNRARLNQSAGRVSPLIPQTSKCKQGIVLHAEVERLFLFPAAPPFEKPVGREQAPTVQEGISEGGLTRNRFRAGVDRLESDTGVCGPGRNQAPASDRKVSLRSRWIPANNSDRLRRGNVVARFPIDLAICLEIFLNQLLASG